MLFYVLSLKLPNFEGLMHRPSVNFFADQWLGLALRVALAKQVTLGSPALGQRITEVPRQTCTLFAQDSH